MGIVARIEANGRKLAVVETTVPHAESGKGYQLRDVTYGETDHPGTQDGIGRVVSAEYATLERAMREAHVGLFGVQLVEPRPERPADASAAAYFSGDETVVGAGG